jgi:hypothetical protein
MEVTLLPGMIMPTYSVNLKPVMEMTDEQFYQLCQANPELKVELRIGTNVTHRSLARCPSQKAGLSIKWCAVGMVNRSQNTSCRNSSDISFG